MNITLYQSTAETNRLNKTAFLTPLATYTNAIDRRQDMSMVNVTVALTCSKTNVAAANYAYVAEWNSYYYINEKTETVNGLVEFHMTRDPLMTFRSAIESCPGIVEKNERLYNMYMPGNVPHDVRPLMHTIKMEPAAGGAAFNTQGGVYVLLAIGGV